jgi:hypothetical protein
MNTSREAYDLHNPACRRNVWRRLTRWGAWKSLWFWGMVVSDTWGNVCPPKDVLQPKKALLKLRGLYRVFFRFCPKCNSSAPAMDSCSVCHGDRRVPSNIQRREWWERYTRELDGIPNTKASNPGHE